MDSSVGLASVTSSSWPVAKKYWLSGLEGHRKIVASP